MPIPLTISMERYGNARFKTPKITHTTPHPALKTLGRMNEMAATTNQLILDVWR
jgi:hypothetical protein